jgi:hypothetical protein
LRILLYSKPECHLCEEAKAVIKKVAAEFQVSIDEIDIRQDPGTFEKYRYDIPVIFLDDVKLFKHRVDEAKLRRALRARGSAQEHAETGK